MWEREWRFQGNLRYKYSNVVAIIAENPKDFLLLCEETISDKKMNLIKKIPLISPEWTYEELIEQMSCSIWEDYEPLSND